jgi:hypothetical protein
MHTKLHALFQIWQELHLRLCNYLGTHDSATSSLLWVDILMLVCFEV